MRQECRNLGDSKPWTSISSVRCLGLPRNARFLDCVDVAYGYLCNQTIGPIPESESARKAAAKDFWVNPTQCVKRKPWTQKGPNSVLRDTKWYSFNLDRTLTGKDHLAMLGYDTNTIELADLTDSDIRDLAGEGMDLACLSAVLFSILLGGSFPGLFEVGDDDAARV